MTVNGISKGLDQTPVTPDSQVPGKALTQSDFMKLFLMQMKTQNPMKPFDSGEMMQQMSQLTSLSATQQLESTIKLMNANMGRSQVLSATQLIGKRVAVASDKSPLIQNSDGTSGLDGSIVLPKASTSSTVEIRDASNNLVKTITLPASGSGVQDFHWDGKNEKNEQMEPGFYSISAKGNFGSESRDLYTAGVFKINSVTMDPSTSSVILNVDGLGGMDMGNIIKILS